MGSLERGWKFRAGWTYWAIGVSFQNKRIGSVWGVWVGPFNLYFEPGELGGLK